MKRLTICKILIVVSVANSDVLLEDEEGTLTSISYVPVLLVP